MYDDEERKMNGNEEHKDVFKPIEADTENHVLENQVSFDDLNRECEAEETNAAEELNLELNKENKNEYISESKAEAAEERKRAPYEPIKDTYYKETFKNKKKGRSFKKVIAACLVVSLFGGAGIGISYSAMQNLIFNKDSSEIDINDISEAENTTGTRIAQAQPVSNSNGTMTAVEVIDAVSPAVVNINTSVSGTTNYYGFTVPYEGNGSGSGVIFDSDEEKVYILTNNHVVDGAKEVTISVTGAESIPARIVGTDSMADMAVISALRSDFKAAGIEDIVVAKFGDSDKLKVGESVIAIGNALGEGKSATGGMISILNKNIDIQGLTLNVIQTSAAINSGNSGGALVNYSGEIVGINTAKTSTTVAEAMGYAIPSNTAKEVAEKLLKEGTTPKPYIGIMGSDISEDVSSVYKLPVGVLVRQVIDGGAAYKAGLQENDIIVSFDGKAIMTMESLISAISEQEIGKTVEMGIIRNAETPMTLNIEIMDANNLTEENQEG